MCLMAYCAGLIVAYPLLAFLKLNVGQITVSEGVCLSFGKYLPHVRSFISKVQHYATDGIVQSFEPSVKLVQHKYFYEKCF